MTAGNIKEQGKRDKGAGARWRLRGERPEPRQRDRQLLLKGRCNVSCGPVSLRHVDCEMEWQARATAMVICGMRQGLPCGTVRGQVDELAPLINEAAEEMRNAGSLIIHIPGGLARAYLRTAQGAGARKVANASASGLPQKGDLEKEWITLRPYETRYRRCACATRRRCRPLAAMWSRLKYAFAPPPQVGAIHIHPQDAISAGGQGIYTLLAERGIDNLVFAGVHANGDILSGPYGICQMLHWGKKVVLCRDLTSIAHGPALISLLDLVKPEPNRAPASAVCPRSTERFIEYVERCWCPTTNREQVMDAYLNTVSAVSPIPGRR